MFRVHGIHPRIVMETENVEILKALTMIGMGLTIVPYCPFIQAYLRKHPDFSGEVSWPE